MGYVIKEIVSYDSSGCDCCEDVMITEYHLYEDGLFLSSDDYIESAFEEILRLENIQFEVLRGVEQ